MNSELHEHGLKAWRFAIASVLLSTTLGSTACQEQALNGNPTAISEATVPGAMVTAIERSGSSADQPESRTEQEIHKVENHNVAENHGIIFHCVAKNGKEVTLRDLGKTIDYSYGYPGETPEIVLSKPRDEVTTYQWDGSGRWISYSVSVRNGDTTYTVFTSVDRLSDEHEMEAGVAAIVGEREVARVICRPPLVNRLEGLDLNPEG
jgi:hypothetical protein